MAYRAKAREKSREWRKANPDKARLAWASWHAANPDKVLESSRRYYRNHTEIHKARANRWKSANIERVRKAHRDLYWRDIEKNREYQRQRRAANPGRSSVYSMRWIAKNPEKFRAYQLRYIERARELARLRQRERPEMNRNRKARYRARKENAPVVDLTVQQWREILEMYGHRCAYCDVTGLRLEQEHVVPLSRGGSHTVANVVPACRSCNARKRDRTWEPRKPHGECCSDSDEAKQYQQPIAASAPRD